MSRWAIQMVVWNMKHEVKNFRANIISKIAPIYLPTETNEMLHLFLIFNVSINSDYSIYHRTVCSLTFTRAVGFVRERIYRRCSCHIPHCNINYTHPGYSLLWFVFDSGTTPSIRPDTGSSPLIEVTRGRTYNFST
jgi:hypothetical protein